MLVNTCNTLAEGLVQPWVPPPPSKKSVDPAAPGDVSPANKKGRPTPAASKSKPTVSVTINPDGTPDLKAAVEACEYAMKVTNGECYLDVVPISVRLPLLQTWVKAKQMLQSQIEKSLGSDNAVSLTNKCLSVHS